jgi:hypothetical protein
VHIVNYDVDYERDSIRPKRGIGVSIPAPAFVRNPPRGVLYDCETADGVPIGVEHGTGRLEWTIPDLGLGAVVAISAAATE